MNTTARRLPILLLTLLLAMTACNLQQQSPPFAVTLPRVTLPAVAKVAPEPIPPYTPLATLTPSPTLRPPPTFEPPTATLPPTAVPSVTATSTLDLSVSIPGL